MKNKKNLRKGVDKSKDTKKKRRPKPLTVSTFDKSGYTNTYIRANYDRVGILVPPGMKDALKEEASKRGTSVTGLIIDVLAKALKISVEAPEKVKVEVPPLSKKKRGKKKEVHTVKEKAETVQATETETPEA